MPGRLPHNFSQWAKVSLGHAADASKQALQTELWWLRSPGGNSAVCLVHFALPGHLALLAGEVRVRTSLLSPLAAVSLTARTHAADVQTKTRVAHTTLMATSSHSSEGSRYGKVSSEAPSRLKRKRVW